MSEENQINGENVSNEHLEENQQNLEEENKTGENNSENEELAKIDSDHTNELLNMNNEEVVEEGRIENNENNENVENKDFDRIGPITVLPFEDDEDQNNNEEIQQPQIVEPIDENNEEEIKNQTEKSQNNETNNEEGNKHENSDQGDKPVPPPHEEGVQSEEYNPDDDVRTWLCPICMEEIHDPVVTPCGHVYCKRCIEEWLKRHPVCPTCNKGGLIVQNLLPLKDIGLKEDRPEPDNTLEANTLPKRIAKYVKNHILKKDFLIYAIVYIMFGLSFFIQ